MKSATMPCVAPELSKSRSCGMVMTAFRRGSVLNIAQGTSGDSIQALVGNYQGLTPKDRNSYNEANTVNAFIRPLFEALGWDFSIIDEVEAEKTILKGRVDY